MPKKKIIIMGAGLAGLSAAWHLQKKGLSCLVFEKEPEVGGLCRSKKINGFIFDCSGHLLHFKRRYSLNLVESLLKNNLAEHKRSAWIYSYGRYTRYPFQANLYGLPSRVAKECLAGFIEVINDGKFKDGREPSFRDWINFTFGRGIARHFMIPYNNKFWTLPPEAMNCEWVNNFIPVPTLEMVIDGTIEESKRQFGYNAHFWYPESGGIRELPLAFARQLKNIHTDCPVIKINLEKKEITLASGEREGFDYLISTVPLVQLRHMAAGLPVKVASWLNKLKWNSILNLNLGLSRKDSFHRHWVYFPQRQPCFFRLGFPHNFSSCVVPEGCMSLYAEVAYSRYRPIDRDAIVPRIRQDLKDMGMLAGDAEICVDDVNDIQYGYPIYDAHYNQARPNIIKYFNQKRIYPCGRYGSWRYMSMEDAILDGKRVAECLIANA